MTNLINITDDHAVVNRVQQLRDTFITQLVKGGKLPDSKDDRDLLVKLLSDSTSTALTRMRIKSDDEKSKNDANVAMQIADAISKYNPNNHARRIKPIEEVIDLPAYIPKPGETQTGVIPVSYKEIMGAEDTVKDESSPTGR